MASEVSICNAALTLVGENSIASLTDPNSTSAIACNEAYARLRDAEFRKNIWSFTVSRAELAAAATGPIFGKANYFPVPADFLRVIPLDSGDNLNDHDWQIENTGSQIAIATQEKAPLFIRYVARVTDPNKFDTLFQDALAGRIGQVIATKITQSNAQYLRAKDYYDDAVAEAKRINSIEKPVMKEPVDSWITARA